MPQESEAPVLVSACLTGQNCRYNGQSAPHPTVVEWLQQGRCIAVCPEMLGGLPCPRPPGELRNGRVFNSDGHDCTSAYHNGAVLALEIARRAGCRMAVLKARSPACGVGRVYDGTFSGRLVPGNGLFAQAALDAGLRVLSDEDV